MPGFDAPAAIDARERLLEQLTKLRAVSAAEPSAENSRKYDSHLAEVEKLWTRYSAMTGARLSAEYPTTPDGLFAWLTEAAPAGDASSPSSSLPGMVHHGVSRGVRPAISGLGPSWTDAVFRGRDIHAGVIDPSGGAVISVPIRATVATDPRRARFVRELVPEEDAPGGLYGYLKQTVRTFNAAAVAKLERKPTSIFTLKKVEDRTRTIAHITEPIARQDMADAEAVRQFIDDELRLGVYLELDREMVQADGSGEQLTGFLEAGIGTHPGGSDLVSTTRGAITKLQKLEVVPTAWAINPDDWEAIELEAIETFAASAGQVAPSAVLEQRLWSVPVLVTNAVPAGTALLGDFAGSAVLYTTGQIRVDWSENVYDKDFDAGEGASDFERNAIRFRGEGRWGLAVTRPTAFVAVDVALGS